MSTQWLAVVVLSYLCSHNCGYFLIPDLFGELNFMLYASFYCDWTGLSMRFLYVVCIFSVCLYIVLFLSLSSWLSFYKDE